MLDPDIFSKIKQNNFEKQVKHIPTYSSNVNFDYYWSLTLPKEIKINHAIQNQYNNCPQILSESPNIYNWVVNLQVHSNLEIKYNEIDAINLPNNKFIDFKLKSTYNTQVYYKKTQIKYATIIDQYGLIKYDLINKLKHKKTLILTSRPNHWSKKLSSLCPKLITKYTSKINKQICILDYSNITTSIVRKYSWKMVVLDNFNHLIPKRTLETIYKLTNKFGLIFTNRLENQTYQNIYQLAFQSNIISKNYNLHQFYLTNFCRRIETSTLNIFSNKV